MDEHKESPADAVTVRGIIPKFAPNIVILEARAGRTLLGAAAVTIGMSKEKASRTLVSLRATVRVMGALSPGSPYCCSQIRCKHPAVHPQAYQAFTATLDT